MASDMTDIPTLGPTGDPSTAATSVATTPTGRETLRDESIMKWSERLLTPEEVTAKGPSVFAYISRPTDASLEAFAKVSSM